MTSSSDQPLSPQTLAARKFARWAMLKYIQHLETDSIVGVVRDTIFEEPSRRAEEQFPSAGLDTRVLLGQGYSSIPYIWGLLRMKKDAPVQAEALWPVVLKHLAKDVHVEMSMDTSRPLDRYQIHTIQTLLDGYETALNGLADENPGVAIVMGFATEDQERQLLGFGGYPGPKKSALLAAVRDKRNPLPMWEIGKEEGKFFVIVVPAALRLPFEQWFTVRAFKYPMMSTHIDFMVDMPSAEDWEGIATALGLMFAGIDENQTDKGYRLDGVLEYVAHSLLQQHESD